MENTQRFSNRVDFYVKYRPSYPLSAINFLYDTIGFSESSEVADVGSGTGILTKLLLDRNTTVFAVEPNREMREMAEQLLKGCPNFRSIGGTAEATLLEDKSVDFVISAQAFHWFQRNPAQQEFQRIIQSLDLEGLRGRMTSSSYMPLHGDPRYPLLMEELTMLFNRYNRAGVVTIQYRTDLFYGEV